MKDLRKNFKVKTAALFLATLCLASTFNYNQKRAFAREIEWKDPEPIVCEEVIDIEFPGTGVDVIDPINFPLEENILEIPIGKSVEEIEAIAEDILYHLEILIAAAHAEEQAAKRMHALINLCGTGDFSCPIDSIVCQQTAWKPTECSLSDPDPGGDYCKIDDGWCGDCPDYCDWDDFDRCSSESCECERSGCGCAPPWDKCCYEKKEEDCWGVPEFTCVSCLATCAGCPVGEKECEDDCCEDGCDYDMEPGEPECPDPSCALSCLTCPAGIAGELATIKAQAVIITEQFAFIDYWFIHQFFPAILVKTQHGQATPVRSIVSVPWGGYNLDTIAGSQELCELLRLRMELCITPIEWAGSNDTTNVEGKLDMARYGLAECFIEPTSTEKMTRGETPGKFFLSCLKVLDGKIVIHSFLDGDIKLPDGSFKEGCFGNTYCFAEGMGGPCAEDFYCCGMIKEKEE